MSQILIRPIETRDIPQAARVCNLAFGTYIGHPDPERTFGEIDFFRARVGAPNAVTLVAERGGEIIASNMITRWGSVAFFGPLSVRPDLWDAGVGKLLLAPTMATFDQWGVTLRGLFTFAQSAKHVGLYHKLGFYPRFLTAVMGGRVRPEFTSTGWTAWSEVAAAQRTATIAGVRTMLGALWPGLDVTDEFSVIEERNLGDTVLLGSPTAPEGVAICHIGPGTEAGKDVCYVKFGAVAPGAGAAERFGRLLDAIEALAAQRGVPFITLGVNTEREQAYKALLARGFKTRMQGVIMHAPNVPGYNAPDAFVLDDWR
jgi:predicted N-acetyltransferase YhbS